VNNSDKAAPFLLLGEEVSLGKVWEITGFLSTLSWHHFFSIWEIPSLAKWPC